MSDVASGDAAGTPALSMLVRRLASTTPRNGEWEQSYRALQAQARALLATLQTTAPAPDIRD
jgi:hypothetical protein